MNVTRKVTHNLPFVRIHGYFISPQSEKGPFRGGQDFDCMALYDTGAAWTIVCAESYGVELQSGVSQALLKLSLGTIGLNKKIHRTRQLELDK